MFFKVIICAGLFLNTMLQAQSHKDEHGYPFETPADRSKHVRFGDDQLSFKINTLRDYLVVSHLKYNSDKTFLCPEIRLNYWENARHTCGSQDKQLILTLRLKVTTPDPHYPLEKNATLYFQTVKVVQGEETETSLEVPVPLGDIP